MLLGGNHAAVVRMLDDAARGHDRRVRHEAAVQGEALQARFVEDGQLAREGAQRDPAFDEHEGRQLGDLRSGEGEGEGWGEGWGWGWGWGWRGSLETLSPSPSSQSSIAGFELSRTLTTW